MSVVKNIPNWRDVAGFYVYTRNAASNAFVTEVATGEIDFIKDKASIRGLQMRCSLRMFEEGGKANATADYDWAALDRSIKKCRDAGKKLNIEFMWTQHSGATDALRVLPKYMTDPANFATYQGGHYRRDQPSDKPNTAPQSKWYPRFWVPGVAARIAAFCTAFGERYGENATIGAFIFTETALATVKDQLWGTGETPWTSAGVRAGMDAIYGAAMNALPKKIVSMFGNHMVGMDKADWEWLLKKYCEGRGMGIGGPDQYPTERIAGGGGEPKYPDTANNLSWMYTLYKDKVPICMGSQQASSKQLIDNDPTKSARVVYDVGVKRLHANIIAQAYFLRDPKGGEPVWGVVEATKIFDEYKGETWNYPNTPSLIGTGGTIPDPGDPGDPDFPAPSALAVVGDALTWTFSDSRGKGFRIVASGRRVALGADKRSVPLADLGLAVGANAVEVYAVAAARALSPAATLSITIAAAAAPSNVCVVQGASPKITWAYTEGANPVLGFEILDGTTVIGMAGPKARELPGVTLSTGAHEVRVRAVFRAATASNLVNVTVTDPVTPGTTCTS